MWESIPPNASSITQQQKLRWSNITIGQDAKNNILLATDFTWTVHSPSHGFSSYYPAIDHTLRTYYGSYLLLKNESPRKAGDRAVLMSDRYDITSSKAICFRFNYWLKNIVPVTTYSKLGVFQSENYTQVKKIAEYALANTNTWVQVNLTIVPENKSSSDIWIYLVSREILLYMMYNIWIFGCFIT